MNKDELREWFYEKLFNCYYVNHKTKDDVKYLVYDKQFIRDCKLSSLVGGDITFPMEHTGDILFQQNSKNKIFFCSYRLIWSFFESNYKDDNQEIQDLIKEFLGEIDNYKEYTAMIFYCNYYVFLGEIDNYKEYTACRRRVFISSNLSDIYINSQLMMTPIKTQNVWVIYTISSNQINNTLKINLCI